jgi:lipopolysaccharide heptosyltransferase II
MALTGRNGAGKDPGNWHQAGSILCVRLDSAGDVLMTTPALRALKTARRGRKLTLLTSPAGAAVGRMVPEIDEVIAYAAPWVKNDVPGNSRREYAILRMLRERRFEGAVIFCVFSQNPMPAALLCYLADIPLRLAYCRENPYQVLTHWVPDPDPESGIRHEVQRQLDLVGTIGCPAKEEEFSLRIPARARRSVHRLLRELPVAPDRPLVVIHPGATALSRRYPAEQFAAVADGVIRDLGAGIVFTGSPAEIPLVERVRSLMRMPSLSVAGRLEMEQLCALIAAADLLISNNTGPVHIAAAVRTRTVDIYAMTNPQHTPWKVESRVLTHDVPCRYCYKSICPEGHHQCLQLITPELVVSAAGELLAGPKRKPENEECHVHAGYQRSLS